MKKYDFTRTVITTTIHINEVKVKEGVSALVNLEPISIPGTKKMTKEQVEKYVKNNFNGIMVVTRIEYKEEVRGMKIEDFLRYSEPCTRPTSQQKKKEE